MDDVRISRWQIGPISTPKLEWGAVHGGRVHKCATCGILLLTGESSGFCCGPNGSKFAEVHPLPPLPQEFISFINNPNISKNSRVLNLIFSFASLETTHPFPHITGGASFVAIQGKVYHHVRPNHNSLAIRWLFHDGFIMEHTPHTELADTIPSAWKEAFRAALIRINPLVSSLRNFAALDITTIPTAHLLLQDSGSSSEIAAIMSFENMTHSQIKSQCLTISRTSGSVWKVPTVSRLWEPLAYPLFFPHGTLDWGVIGSGRDIRYDLPNTAEADAPTTQMWHY